jgi:hypothetical protein
LGISFYYTIPRQVFPPETARFGRASVKLLTFHARISSEDWRLVFEPRERLIPAGNQDLNPIFAFSERFAYKMRIRNKSEEVLQPNWEPQKMDIVVIMFGSVISTMTALTFLEVRRIRKITQSRRLPAPPHEPAPPDSGARR